MWWMPPRQPLWPGEGVGGVRCLGCGGCSGPGRRLLPGVARVVAIRVWSWAAWFWCHRGAIFCETFVDTNYI